MSQVDFIIYIPLLFWFIIFFIIFYIFMYIYIIPLLFSTLKVKSLFFYQLIKDVYLFNLFLEINYLLNYKNFSDIIYKGLKFSFVIKFIYNLINIKELIK